MENVIEQVAEAASNWWVQRITKPNYNFDIGFMGKLATECKQDLSEMQLTNFKSELKNYIIAKLNKLEDDTTNIVIYTEFSPMGILGDISKKYVIDDVNFPWHTYMEIGRQYCTIQLEEGSEKEFVFTTEDFLKHLIKEASSNLKYWEAQDDLYFDKWSNFSKTSIISEARTNLKKCRQALEDYKNGKLYK